MRLPYVRPILIMSAVENAFRITLVAVPALSRVEPVRASGPVSATTLIRASSRSGAVGLQVTSTVNAPAAPAARSAPAT